MGALGSPKIRSQSVGSPCNSVTSSNTTGSWAAGSGAPLHALSRATKLHFSLDPKLHVSLAAPMRIVLVGLLTAGAAAQYTYKFEYDLFLDPPPSVSVIPIDGMPATQCVARFQTASTSEWLSSLRCSPAAQRLRTQLSSLAQSQSPESDLRRPAIRWRSHPGIKRLVDVGRFRRRRSQLRNGCLGCLVLRLQLPKGELGEHWLPN